ncbi:MAG: hypothetical protein M1826_006872 [Phylliscum demangeonii]|nr:MAG: hypothetical protein M1826_006872 [Phylliscum demangeonii]
MPGVLRIWLALAALAAVSTIATPIAEQAQPPPPPPPLPLPGPSPAPAPAPAAQSRLANGLRSAGERGLAALAGAGLARAWLGGSAAGFKSRLRAAADRESTQSQQIARQDDDIFRLERDVEAHKHTINTLQAALQQAKTSGVARDESSLWIPPAAMQDNHVLLECVYDFLEIPVLDDAYSIVSGLRYNEAGKWCSREHGVTGADGWKIPPGRLLKIERTTSRPSAESQAAGRGAEVLAKAEAARAYGVARHRQAKQRKQGRRGRPQPFTLLEAPPALRRSWNAAVREVAHLEGGLARELPVLKFAGEHHLE